MIEFSKELLALADEAEVALAKEFDYIKKISFENTARVMAAFADVTGMDNVTPDSHFQYDLGGDSLQYFSLIERIGADFGVTIDTHAAPELNTPRAVAAYILKEAE